ncbi:MAG: tetratricopeptide repeat protein [Planctomycetota bacterium]|jgi:tetratricopeptide (TPR) repeat protein
MLFEDMEFGYYNEAEQKARRAYDLYEDGKMSQALNELETAITINPSNSSWHFNKGLTLDSVNRFEEAISEYEIALQLNPNDLETLNSLAVDYTRTGQYDLAIDVFEQIEEINPEFEPSYCNRIITYTEMEQHDLAEQMFYLAQQVNPDCALCYYNIGNSLFVRGEYKKAVRCWLRTAELESEHPQINYRIAQAYWCEGDHERAGEYFLAELRTNPGDVEVILDYGLFLLELGQIESAKEKFNRILELDPDSATALFYLGEIALDNNKHSRAAELFKQALSKDNTLMGPRYRLAQCAFVKGQNQKATGYLLAELRQAPQDPHILTSIGSLFLKIGEADHAATCLLRAAESDSTNAEAYYLRGLNSAIQGRFEDAAEFIGHTLDIEPQNIRALRDSAIVHLAMGQTLAASEKIAKARMIAADDPQLKKLERQIKLAHAARGASDFVRHSLSSLIRFRRRRSSHN